MCVTLVQTPLLMCAITTLCEIEFVFQALRDEGLQIKHHVYVCIQCYRTFGYVGLTNKTVCLSAVLTADKAIQTY